MKKRYIAILALIIGLAFVGWSSYQKVVKPNVVIDYPVKIPTGTSFEGLVEVFARQEILTDLSSFKTVAGWMKYDKAVIKPGHYKLKEGWSNRTLIAKLRSGNQDGVRVTINNVRDLKAFCGKITQQLELDSTDLVDYLYDPEIASKESVTKEELLTLFIPNTYELWWNTSKEDLLARLLKERGIFWSKNNRLGKANKLGLDEEEVYTLASIVEKETNQNSEKARIAGVYLNRLQRGILLQADPTVVYANGDFSLRRVHAFATNLIGHNKNAQRYWRWLKKNNIR